MSRSTSSRLPGPRHCTTGRPDSWTALQLGLPFQHPDPPGQLDVRIVEEAVKIGRQSVDDDDSKAASSEGHRVSQREGRGQRGEHDDEGPSAHAEADETRLGVRHPGCIAASWRRTAAQVRATGGGRHGRQLVARRSAVPRPGPRCAGGARQSQRAARTVRSRLLAAPSMPPLGRGRWWRRRRGARGCRGRRTSWSHELVRSKRNRPVDSPHPVARLEGPNSGELAALAGSGRAVRADETTGCGGGRRASKPRGSEA